jgi:phytoene dehydrogenase-like protein
MNGSNNGPQALEEPGADYDDFKETLSQKLLADVYKQVPQVRGKVDYYELSTPLSTAHFSNYDHGQVYGMEHSPRAVCAELGQAAAHPSKACT